VLSREIRASRVYPEGTSGIGKIVVLGVKKTGKGGKKMGGSCIEEGKERKVWDSKARKGGDCSGGAV